ncbi:MAG TPA: mannosyltransferase family protein [Verrucomicrobiae bacterium]|nr:mannosyltransferase family protein [Verrucomicrobiae bacterium]
MFKVGYFALICAASIFWPNFDKGVFFSGIARWPPEGGPDFASHFGTWDAAHYLLLSKVGYAKNSASCAFYPLWPLAIRFVANLTGADHLIVGLLLANGFSLAGWLLFYYNTSRRFGESVASLALILLITFPGSLFYQFVYSESLFFLILMLLFFGLERNQSCVALLAAFLLPLTRGVGVFSILPIVWHAFRHKQVGIFPIRGFRPWPKIFMRSGHSQTSCGAAASVQHREHRTVQMPGRTSSVWCFKIAKAIWCQTNYRNVAIVFAPIMGLLTYFCLIKLWTGNPFEGLQAQKYWRNIHSIRNLWNLPKFVVGFLSPDAWHAFKGSVLDRGLFLILMYTLPRIWRLGKDMLIWAYVLGILPAMSGTFVSFTRFESIVFPMFVALASFFYEAKNKFLLLIVITVSVTLHAILVWRFVNFRWAG